MRNGDYLVESGCTPVIGPEGDQFRRVQLYNVDGTVWYEFSVVPRDADSFVKPGTADKNTQKKPGFLPFKINNWNHIDAPAMLVLRISGQSPNWYEVEINEKTRETKFAPRFQPRMWRKVTGSFFLHKSVTLKIDSRKTELLDAPDGKIVDGTTELNLDWVQFVRADGEWAFVERWIGNRRYSGWIRWRNDREILVGCQLNDDR